MNANHAALIAHLRTSGVLRTPRIIHAFEAIDRAGFVPEDTDAGEVYGDYPLPIGFGQTISQPTTVAFMFEALAPEPGENVLDVGSGSGWTTALLADIVGAKGRVIGVEIIPELVAFGQKNLGAFPFQNAEIRQAGHNLGLHEEAPFDRILVSAAAHEKIPQELIDQLSVGGRMILPVEGALWRVEKLSETDILQEKFPGFVFVPLKY